MLSGCTVLGFCGITAANKPACRAEDVSVAEDGLVAVDTDRGNMDHLALLDRDRIDPRAVSTANGLAERDDIVLFNGLLITGSRREHAHGLLAYGIEVGKEVGVDKVIVGRLASDGLDFVVEFALNVRVLCEGPRGEGKYQRRRFVAGNAVKFILRLDWRGCTSSRIATEHLHQCYNVLINF